MNTKIKKILFSGKKSKGNLKAQFNINVAVITGFVLLVIWSVFLYPKTFMDIKFILALLFLPSILVTILLYKKILVICGYETYIKNNTKYNAIITTATYFLVTVPIGNLIVATFLFINYFFAQSEIQVISIKPYYIEESNSKVTHSLYTHIDVEWDNLNKRINVGSKLIESISDKILKVKISKGLFGYYIIRGYRFEK